MQPIINAKWPLIVAEKLEKSLGVHKGASSTASFLQTGAPTVNYHQTEVRTSNQQIKHTHAPIIDNSVPIPTATTIKPSWLFKL